MPRPSGIRVHTESPIDDLWSYFRRCEVIDWLHGRPGKARPLGADEAAGHCIRQAREYFRSARSAALLTRPVLLYYGMVTLGKLLLLLDETQPVGMDEIEEFERRGHGLRQHDPEASADGTYHLEDSQLEVTAHERRDGTSAPFGIFPQLALRICPTGGATWFGQRFNLIELLRSVPQVDLQMRQAFDETTGYRGVWAETMEYPDGRTEIKVIDRVGNPVNAVELRERTPYLDWAQLSLLTNDTPYGKLAIEVSDQLDVYRFLGREEFTGSSWILPADLRGERFDGLLAQYMLMYALSIVARYKPHRWAEILEGRRSPMLPVLERLMGTAERWWPNLVLNRLEHASVLFAGSSYVG